MQSLVFAPSHITGFFEIIDHPNPLIKGSRGAGVVLDQGVLTKVDVCEGNGELIIKTNGKTNDHNSPLESSVTYKTMDLLKNHFSDGIEWNNLKITIDHEINVPIESGFGASAGFALGTSIGLSKLLKLPLTFNQAAAVAHNAEVDLKTGLGDVIGSVVGGFPIRIEPGAPGQGKADKLLDGCDDRTNNEEGLFVISKSLGTIETASVLTDPAMASKLSSIARELLQKLLINPQVTHFMDLSLEFAQKTGLIDPEVMEIVDVLKDETLGASMAMLGKTAFAISDTPDSSVEGSMVARVDHCGCRIV
ncbi:pantoate kinase [Methanobacterium formicicum]|uniref:Pantoate kinase n=1 Tax=Methanobacterium formicicum (strain DSM 3637 / PP1) TaxID=1204725 RepID=K2RBJ1_METFP|nr:pantoate kinase [Methanobacterium formicicum]EKF85679.1 GHMP kinase [Methanobacterium formicicum DSM 3637]